jgi:hypothetical protein
MDHIQIWPIGLSSKYIYKEYHSVCSIVGIGTLPPPLSPASVPLPPEPKGGGHTRLRVRGWGSPNSDDWRKSLAHSPAGDGLAESQLQRLETKLSILPTLWASGWFFHYTS